MCKTLFKIGSTSSGRGLATSKSKLLRLCMQERTLREVSADMAMIMKDSIVRLEECRASSINLTVACCKLDIASRFLCPLSSVASAIFSCDSI